MQGSVPCQGSGLAPSAARRELGVWKGAACAPSRREGRDKESDSVLVVATRVVLAKKQFCKTITISLDSRTGQMISLEYDTDAVYTLSLSGEDQLWAPKPYSR